MLIPEVVKRGDLEIGRYEVMRAQFAAFDKNYKMDAGHGKLSREWSDVRPGQGLCRVARKATGQTWRLPTEKEAAGWYDKKDGENTLDYWAGYAPNPDDSEAPAESEGAGWHRATAETRGKFPGQGKEDEELVFDLGGNVAEWVADRMERVKWKAEARIVPRTRVRAARRQAEYIGFRVVRGAAKP